MLDCPVVTILTPTFNRADTLPILIDSLYNQSSTDFQWLIIDDGSTDNTAKIFEDLKLKAVPFQWEYHRKENGGKHTALNASHPFIKGELVLILDSDDYLTEDAVETIQKEWPRYREQKAICGMSYFKGESKDTHLSVENPEDEYINDHIHYRINHSVKGDHCEVIRTDILKQYPFPVHRGERFMPESWLWNTVGMNYKTVYRNKTIYICNYLDGGLTKSGRILRMKCPFGMMDDCRTYFNQEVFIRWRIKEALLYWVYARCAGYTNKKAVTASSWPTGIILTLIPGSILYLYWKRKYKYKGN